MSAAATLPPGITVLERGWLSSNNVLFDDGDAVSVVDTGYGTHAEQTVALIRHAARGKPLARIVNTHLHSDHVGGNAALRTAFGAHVLIPPGLADAVRRWDEEALSYAPTGQYCPRFDFDALLAPGQTLRLGGLDWRVVAAPGHDPHMVVLYNDDERILLSADALWENGFGAIFPELEGESGFAEQRAVLEWIAHTRPRLVIPGHGAPFTEVDAALARAFSRLQALAADPERNARHVARVLVKFWLLQVRETTLPALLDRLLHTRYVRLIHARYFPSQPPSVLLERALMELVAGGAAERRGDRVIDRG
ncbi:MAG: MBL fold metallo-hydrolase [Burkholderiaceae bacterium]|nr:MBL fold metallo-hydrolase [Burkholderiaceae bacterium]